MTDSEWARGNIAAAHRLILATLEVLLVRRAELDARIARVKCAIDLDDASVLRPGDVAQDVAEVEQS